MTGTRLSPRLRAVVDALPLAPGMRVIDIGCGPGAATRAIAERVPGGHVLGIDRSERAIETARATATREPISGATLAFEQSTVEDFSLAAGEAPYDLAIAVRVGAFDGRHPDLYESAVAAIATALRPDGHLLIERHGTLINIAY